MSRRLIVLAGALAIALGPAPASHAQSAADSVAVGHAVAAVLTRGLTPAANTDRHDEYSRALAASAACVRVAPDSLLPPGAFRTALEDGLGGTRFLGPSLQPGGRRSHTVRALVFAGPSPGDSAGVQVRESYSGGRPGTRAWGGDEEYGFRREPSEPARWRYVGRGSVYHWDGEVVGEVGEPRRPPVC